MSDLWSEMAKRAKPYEAGEQSLRPGTVKLNTNENPYPPCPPFFKALESCLGSSLRTYPDPNSSTLRQAIARLHGVNENQVFAGNGSDEVLGFAFMAFFRTDRTIRFPEVTYSFYPAYAQLFGIPYEKTALREDFTIDEARFFGSEGGVIFPNPNAPTGIVLPLSAVRDICMNNGDRPVIVDEAYIDFGGETAISAIAEFKNLLIVRTLSKSRSLAGLRVGYAVGQEDMIEALNRVKNSFNSYPLDRLAQAAAQAAIEDESYFNETVSVIKRTRETAQETFVSLGFDVLPSSANFLFVRPPVLPAEQLYRELKDRGILVRHFKQKKTEDWLRVSIGKEEEMAQLYRELADILSAAIQT
ncbi:histidinol-phosphate transaminase [Sporosarcina koreensis]|uniref:histidinol-phosphate transaminase n=1 Tax=Sporosarcina koreensis TaxID=334735 RepID=UPI00059003F2|nr:histidinol-phosphate transaminase [Sporosarcina koreensis]